MFSLMAGSFQQLTNWGEDETHDTEDEAKEESDVDSESGLSDDDDGGGSSLSGDGDEKFDVTARAPRGQGMETAPQRERVMVP
jgi:hypothetical protein